MSPKQLTTSIIIIIILILAIIVFWPKNLTKKNISIPQNTIANADNLFSLPLFYLDANGKSHPIDTKIVKSTNTKYDYANTTNIFQTYFPKNSLSNIKFEKNNSSIEFSIISELTIKKFDNQNRETIVSKKSTADLKPSQGRLSDAKNQNKFSYSKIYQNGDKFIDINYTIYSYKLAEEMVLNKFQDFPELTQHLKLTNAYIKIEGSQINFYHQKTNKLIWFISLPYMYEQNNPSQQNFGLTYELKCRNPAFNLENCTELSLTKKYTAEGRAWLSDPTRKFPIVIDPVINNADALTGWSISDTTTMSTAVDTGVKYEGTGSIRVSAIGNSNCWSTNGTSCDSNCNTGTTTSHTVYTDCYTDATCGGNFWSTNGGLSENTNCTYGNSSSQTVYTSCNSEACVNAHWSNPYGPDSRCMNIGYTSGTEYSGCTDIGGGCYTATGAYTAYWSTGCCTCSGDGSGDCYAYNYSPTGAYLGSNCDPGNPCNYYEYYGRPTAPDSCNWVSAQYKATVSGATTGYTLSGPCSSSCYAANGSPSSYYTASGGCPSSSCSSDTFYGTSPTTCDWYDQKYTWYADNSTTRYTGSGSCSTPGSGSCFKLTNDATEYVTGNGSCDSSPSCTTAAANTYKTVSTCTGITSPTTALNDNITLSTGATDISTATSITFWVYSSGRTGQFLQFGFGEGTTMVQTYNISIGASKTWEQKTWDISGISAANRDAVTKWGFKITNSDIGFTLYFDDIQTTTAPTATPTPPNFSPSSCVIIESPTDSYLIPRWKDNSSNEDGFQLEKNTDGAGFSFLTNVAAGITAYQDNSVSSNHTYSYRIRGFVLATGSTNFSEYTYCPTLNLSTGNFRFEGLQLDGLQLN